MNFAFTVLLPLVPLEITFALEVFFTLITWKSCIEWRVNLLQVFVKGSLGSKGLPTVVTDDFLRILSIMMKLLDVPLQAPSPWEAFLTEGTARQVLIISINMPMDGWIVFGDIMYLCHVPSQIAPGDSLRTLRTLDLCL